MSVTAHKKFCYRHSLRTNPINQERCQPYNDFFHSYMSTFSQGFYFWFSLIYLIIRTLAVSLYSAEINDESKKPVEIFRAIPRESWCLEVCGQQTESYEINNFNLLNALKSRLNASRMRWIMMLSHCRAKSSSFSPGDWCSVWQESKIRRYRITDGIFRGECKFYFNFAGTIITYVEF